MSFSPTIALDVCFLEVGCFQVCFLVPETEIFCTYHHCLQTKSLKFAWIRKKEVAQRRCGLWVDQSQERRHGGRDARAFTLNWPSFDTSLWVEKASLLFGLV